MKLSERQKGMLALLIVALALLLMGILEALLAAEPRGDMDPGRIRQEVLRSLEGRDGVVIWTDRENGRSRVFGNARLLEENFLPGSLMKLITAEAALQSGLHLDYHCKGQEPAVGNKVRHCWSHEGHGPLDLPKALGQSCNLYFMHLGDLLGWKKIAQALGRYGFRQAQGLSPDAKNLEAFAIGDYAAFQVNPGEVARFWNAYLEELNSGKAPALEQGLLRSVSEGTAKEAGARNLQFLAKTGTAGSGEKAYPTHGWFLGAYPPKAPRHTLVVFLKNAHGYREAAQLGGKIFSLALTQK